MHFRFGSLILPYLHTLTVGKIKLHIASLFNHLGNFDSGLIFFSTGKLITWLSGLRCKVSSQRQLVL